MPRPKARHYKRRELATADGGGLVLRTDGTIDLLAADRATVQSWNPEDPEWGAHAFRFGIRVQKRTVAPRGPDTGSAKPGS
ncbi:MAG TPA: hypothetical protein VLM76_05670 [Patescibacteria group bacterium]|nr:hypothetical protein [Patescibacteria group bacterium]